MSIASTSTSAPPNGTGEAELKDILERKTDPSDDVALREKETAIVKLGELYRDQQNAEALGDVVRSSRTFMSTIAKAKTAKLIRTLIDFFNAIPNSRDAQIKVTQENIEWAKSEKRIFLKQNLETRLVALYIETGNHREAQTLIESLLRELKRLDDKMILTEVHLLESRVNHALANLPKARAALTSARTAANAIYCPPILQAQLDLQSGVLHAEEKDYKTGYSYFFEALEGLSSQDDPRASRALKYMLLCKIMLSLPEDVEAIIASKLAKRYIGPDVDAMKAVAAAHEHRSLEEYQDALKTHKSQLSDDPIIRNHLAALYDTLLEQNLVRVIEPYSRVEIDYVAELVKQPVAMVESKLSQMILDKVFHGILDQGAGCLIVFDEPQEDKTYDTALETFKQVGQVVDSLYAKAAKRRVSFWTSVPVSKLSCVDLDYFYGYSHAAVGRHYCDYPSGLRDEHNQDNHSHYDCRTIICDLCHTGRQPVERYIIQYLPAVDHHYHRAVLFVCRLWQTNDDVRAAVWRDCFMRFERRMHLPIVHYLHFIYYPTRPDRLEQYDRHGDTGWCDGSEVGNVGCFVEGRNQKGDIISQD
ncbi:26S proteasome regulatory subunit rpn6 [Cystobasidiomycetes sp. EMM_F5]